MIQIFALISILGAFTFFTCGICVANSIEAHESDKVANVLSFLSLLGALSFIIGLIGYCILC